MNIPRPEYPRPQFVRNNWINLNGEWEFETDISSTGIERGIFKKEHLNGKITVPFCKECPLSGIGDRAFTDGVWYKRSFTLPDGWREADRRTILHIGACDYKTTVYVNGQQVGVHVGGMVSFEMEISALIAKGENDLVIYAQDDTRSPLQPSGKQSASYYSNGACYTRTTGIWQTVWLENVPESYIARSKLTPDAEHGLLLGELACKSANGKTVKVEAFFDGKPVGSTVAAVHTETAVFALQLDELHIWDIAHPDLYDLRFTLDEDCVESYFGMRSITYEDGMFMLNGKRVFQRLVLDQGFYPEGLYTAPDEEALIGDIRRSMDMGFNGARLHQKVFEPRFLYHCDRMGYIVWGEFGDWGLDTSLDGAWRAILPEWMEILKRDYNHPAIVGWCPLNEIAPNADYYLVKQLYDMTHAFDTTRPVIDVSGMTHKPGIGDMMDVHDYEQDPVLFRERYQPLREGKEIVLYNFFLNAPKISARPTFMSEYGGICWKIGENEGWGYGNAPTTEEEYLSRLEGLTKALLENPAFCGFCYTQLTDVEQEINGLYSYDRRPKFSPKKISSIFTAPSAYEQGENTSDKCSDNGVLLE